MRWVRGQPPTREEYEAEVAAARAAELADLEAKMKEVAEAAEKVLGEYATGELTYDQATAALAELGFEHDGRIYRIGAKSGNWYVETETGYQFAGTTAEDLQGGDAAEEASEEE